MRGYKDPDEQANARGWVPVVFSNECDDDGNSANCGDDPTTCECPTPGLDDYAYEDRNGVLYARRLRG